MPIILVVDEGMESREILAGILASLEAKLVFVSSAREALERFAEGDVDVVVSEMVLTHIDGLALARKLRRVDADAEVILLTALERLADLRRALELRLAGYFVKPFAAGDLCASLRGALGRRARLRQAATAAASPRADDRLAAMEDALRTQAEAIRQRERELEEREQACEALLADAESLDPASAGESVSDTALMERMALLEEREAYLEASENALMERSQQLQELETELEHRADTIGVEPGEGRVSEETLNALRQREAALEARIAAQEQELAHRLAEISERERRVSRDESLIRAREQYLRKSESILFSREL